MQEGEALRKANSAMKVAVSAKEMAHDAYTKAEVVSVRLDSHEAIAITRQNQVIANSDKIWDGMKAGLGLLIVLVGFLAKLLLFP